MKEITKEDLLNLLERVYENSRYSCILGQEWVTVDIELYDELRDTLLQAGVKLKEKTTQYE